jgi:hypothetical protein
MNRAALLCMVIAIIAAAFAPVAPEIITGYLKALAEAATGLAALFLHPPGSQPTKTDELKQPEKTP